MLGTKTLAEQVAEQTENLRRTKEDKQKHQTYALNYQREVRKLEAEYKNLEDENAALKQKNAEHVDAMNEWEQSAIDLEGENTKLKAEIGELLDAGVVTEADMVVELTGQRDELQKRIEKLNDVLRGQVVRLETELASIRKQKEVLQGERDEARRIAGAVIMELTNITEGYDGQNGTGAPECQTAEGTEGAGEET